MPTYLYTAPHLPSPVLYDQALRHARKLQNRRAPVVPEPDPARPPLRPTRALRADHDGLSGADHKEHGHATEAGDALSAHYLRRLPRQIPRRALRLLGDLQPHHLRPELRDLLRPPAQARSHCRRQILCRSRKEFHHRARETSGPPGPEEERPGTKQKEKEGR